MFVRVRPIRPSVWCTPSARSRLAEPRCTRRYGAEMSKNLSHMGTGARLAGSGSFYHQEMPRQSLRGATGASSSIIHSRGVSAGYLTSANAIGGLARRGFGQTHNAASTALVSSHMSGMSTLLSSSSSGKGSLSRSRSVSLRGGLADGRSLGRDVSLGHLSTHWPVVIEPTSPAAWHAHLESRWPSVNAPLDTPLRTVKVPWTLSR